MANQVILGKFHEWKSGKDLRSARVAAFEYVRDIPYARIADRNPATELEQMLLQNRGTCNEKHTLLGAFIELLGLELRYVSHRFRWSDLDVCYPADLQQLARQMPVCDHLFIQAKILGKWISIDATWDTPLEAAGFHVNYNWDGYSNTVPAVQKIEEIVHPSLAARNLAKQQLVAGYTPRAREVQPGFYKSFNEWLNSFRNPK